MPDFAVSTTFKGKDRVSRVFGTMGRGSTKFGKDASRAFQKASRSGAGFGNVLKGVLAADVIKRGVGLLTQGLRTAGTEFISFDQAITGASAKFKGLNLATAEGQKTLEKLKTTARTVGAETQFSASQAAEGLDFLAMAGFNAEQSMAALPGVVDLATVANVDLARSTDIASDSLGAFGLMTKDATQLEINFTRINDVMAKTMTSTNTNIEDMFEAIKKGAPTFTSAGQSVETFNALLGVMANSGVKGAEAGTNLRNIMLRLAKPTAEAQKVLDNLGISTSDAKGNFKDVVSILGDFEKGLKGMGTQQKAAALSTVFGARAVTGVNLLLQEGTGAISKFREELMGAGGASKAMADVMRKSLMNRLASLRSAAIEIGFKFITAFEKQGGGAIDKFTTILRNFDPAPIIDGLKKFVTFSGILLNILKPFAPLIPVIVGGMLAYNAVLKAQMAIGAVQQFFAFVKVLRMAAASQGVLNAVMAANPIGLIVTGVAVLIGLTILLVKNWDKVKAAFVSAGAFMLNTFRKVWDVFKKVLAIGSRISGIFGGGGAPAPEQAATSPDQRQAPNTAEVESRDQNINLQGLIQIAGAPEGSTAEAETTGAPPIKMEMLGSNP